MPLTDFQRELLAVLAGSPAAERYLAGGAALHFTPASARYSEDLDFFHDSEARVAAAFEADRDTLLAAGYSLAMEFSQPGFIRAIVSGDGSSTRVDWAHDSAWRFMPLVRDTLGGWLLHPVDIAVSKILALAGRDEARDFVDILFVHERILPVPAVGWAAPGKDPGLTPWSLLELLKRRGRYRAEDFDRLKLVEPLDLVSAKAVWLRVLAEMESFARSRPPEELGCLYYSRLEERFVLPAPDASLSEQGIVAHYGVPGGIIPRIADSPVGSRPE